MVNFWLFGGVGVTGAWKRCVRSLWVVECLFLCGAGWFLGLGTCLLCVCVFRCVDVLADEWPC